MAHPTIRAESLVPRQKAIAPYEVTLPLGICLAISYTCSKKEACSRPDGLTRTSFSFFVVVILFAFAISGLLKGMRLLYLFRLFCNSVVLSGSGTLLYS